MSAALCVMIERRRASGYGYLYDFTRRWHESVLLSLLRPRSTPYDMAKRGRR